MRRFGKYNVFPAGMGTTWGYRAPIDRVRRNKDFRAGCARLCFLELSIEVVIHREGARMNRWRGRRNETAAMILLATESSTR